MKPVKLAAATLALSLAAGAAHAQIRITEWMYDTPTPGAEYIEFTNIGTTAIDLTGWSFDDNSRLPGSVSLGAFGIVAAGESVILTEASATDFRTRWGLAPTVKVIGGNANNIGRSDEINIYNASNALVDRLTYNDQGTGTVQGPRTTSVSGNPGTFSAIGANNASLWVVSSVGDVYGSYADSGVATFSIGNPGKFISPIPEPETYALMVLGLGLAGVIARRRRATATTAA